jgi:hypothetical protein
MSRPKELANWSAERQEKWRKKTRQIARKSYAKNAIERRRRVRVYKAKIRGTVLMEDGYAKKRVRKPEMRKCAERGCSNTMVYKIWINRDRLCKSCKAKAHREKKEDAQRRRRFYKIACAQGEFGKLRMVEIRWDSRDISYAADFHRTEIFERDGSDMYRVYIRDQDHVRGGRPWYRGLRSGAFKDFWVNWRKEASEKAYTGELRRAAEYERELPRRIAEIEARLEREEAERAERRRIAAILAGPKDRATPKGVMAFFQMAEAAQAVNNYVENQNETNNKTEA